MSPVFRVTAAAGLAGEIVRIQLVRE